MRVVAGIAKGRRLHAPPGASTRPTTDQVREAIFNALGSQGGVDGAHVVDLFAGSGGLGIEALSRGAASATFVDHDQAALTVIRRNLADARLDADTTVTRAEVVAWLADAPRFDVAFVDPPYAFDRWNEVLDRLAADVAVLESDRELDLGERWETIRVKRYGGTVVTMALGKAPGTAPGRTTA